MIEFKDNHSERYIACTYSDEKTHTPENITSKAEMYMAVVSVNTKLIDWINMIVLKNKGSRFDHMTDE